MHIYFSGIGGAAIGPLAQVAKMAGYDVSGSDLREGEFITYLKKQGIEDITIGQSRSQIEKLHAAKPIDWLVYSSALPKTDPNHAELLFAQENHIKSSKRDEFINEILSQKDMRLVAIAGTHGKTTTTAMVIWLLKQSGVPISYSLGAQISFGEMGHFEDGSQYFVYECDEFDRNFLAFHPYLSVITGVSWDHHEIFPTRDNYKQAFRDFISQSKSVVLWQREMSYLGLKPADNISVSDTKDPKIDKIKLPGRYNREDAWLALQTVAKLTKEPMDMLVEAVERFPGVGRRFEKITDNLYSDDAHTPEKIQGCMSVAREQAAKTGQKIIVVYEPLTNRRMHYLGEAHRDVFEGAAAIYWLPSFLAREDPKLPVLTPTQLIKNLSPGLQKIATPMELDDSLEHIIKQHLKAGDMVVAMAGGGAGSLDEWLRHRFAKSSDSLES